MDVIKHWLGQSSFVGELNGPDDSKCPCYVLSAFLWELSIATREISDMGLGKGKRRG